MFDLFLQIKTNQIRWIINPIFPAELYTHKSFYTRSIEQELLTQNILLTQSSGKSELNKILVSINADDYKLQQNLLNMQFEQKTLYFRNSMSAC